MQILIKNILPTLTLLFALSSLYAGSLTDTIPPVFTTPPGDTTISCDEDVELLFTNWLNNHAGASADSGEALVMNAITNPDAIQQLDSIQQLSCSSTGQISVGFFAIDSCDNISEDTLVATFIIEDNIAPQFILESQDLNIECQSGITDSLQMWLDNFGYAIINDNCSETIIGSNYNWMDSNGNTGFGTPGMPTNIVIERTTCLWSVDVTFFIEDECSNISTSQAKFNIISDTFPPSVVVGPPDLTLDCSDMIPLQDAVFEDGCDGIIQSVFNEVSTQGTDVEMCTFYNYTLTRTWQATDVCNNSSIWTQVITIEDTEAPLGNFQTTVALNCDDDPADLSGLIEVEDNCRFDTLIYIDNVSNANMCGQDILRQYIVSDVCSNVDTLIQNIRVRDFDGPVFDIIPKDTTVHCSGIPPLAIFNNWRDNFGFGQVSDGCNASYTKALPDGTYADTTQIVATDLVMYNTPVCPISTLYNILAFQLVDFVAYDDCGNISVKRATFTIIDTIPPTITNCPQDRVVPLKVNQCDTVLTLQLPVVEDNCSTPLPEDWTITINNERVELPDSSHFEIYLESGINTIEYTVEDCVYNTSSCSSLVEIKDVVPPILICPDDITIALNDNQCAVNYEYPQLEDYLEVCSAPIDFSIQQPADAGFIEFLFDAQDNKYKARDRTISFRDLNLIGEVYNPVVLMQFKVNVEGGASINLLSELGDILYTIDSSSCVDSVIIVPLNETQFGFWLSDNRVNFTLDYVENNGQAPQACSPGNLNGTLSKDNDAYFRLVLNYADIDPHISTIDLGTGGEIEIIDNHSTLSVGEYQVEYTEDDAFGNEGHCFSFITVEDNIAPVVECQDIILDANIEDSPEYQIEAAHLIQSITDNCGIDTILLSQSTYLCTDIGRSINVELTALDQNNNSSTCSSIVTIDDVRLNPQFVSNLCFADTLQLFGNIDPSLVDSLEWRGPDGFISNELDPIILEINSDNSGVYFLDVTTVDGCNFIGSVNITVNEFSNPQITSDSTAYCVGSQVLLNASVFTEEVSYQWYEGVSPNGILIAETDGPSLLVQPIVGKHFYYVIVSSEDCNSNPSGTLTIDILSVPIAEIDDPFKSICEGDPLSLSTSIFNSTYNYVWSGPNGFFSRDRIPEVIEEADISDQGNYYLVIDNGVCTSDTATAQVVVFPQPATPIIDGQEVVCEGESALLTVANISGASQYYWYKDGVLFSAVSSNTLLIPNITSAQEGLYTVEVEDGICLSERSESFELSIETRLNIGATNSGPVCEGDEVELISSFIPDATYEWIDPSGDVFSGREISVPAVEGSYTVVVTSENSCTATSTTQVEILPKPIITALSNSSEKCMELDSEIELVATVFPPEQYEYSWTGPGNFQSDQIRPVIIASDDSINGTYTLMVSLNGCSSDPVSTMVDFNFAPPMAEIIAPEIVCEDETIVLQIANPATGMDAQWIWSTPNGLMTTTTPSLTIDMARSNNQGLYRVIQSVAGCRSVNSFPVQIIVIPEPEQPALFGSSNICQGDAISLQSTGVAGADYLWTGPTDTVVTADPVLLIEDAGTQQSGLYQVQALIGDCASSPSIAFMVNVNTLPESPVFELDEIEVCLSNPQDIIVCVEQTNDPNIELYEFVDLSSNVRIAQSEKTCIDLTILNTGVPAEFVIGVRSNDGKCTSAIMDTLIIRIAEIPNEGADIVESNQLVCDNEFFELHASVPNEVSIRWESANPAISLFNTDQATVQLTDLPEGRSVIYLFSSVGQCADFELDSVELQVLSPIQAVDDFVSQDYQPVIEIDPLTNDIFNQAVFIEDVTWEGPGEITVDNNMIIYNPESPINTSIEIIYTLCYEACPEACSEATIELEITSESDCFAGNLITPNGDGYNDSFVIPCLEGQQYPDHELFIFNEWGDEVFSAAPYNNDWQGTNNGNILPPGTYFYVLKLGQDQITLQGFIVLEL